MLYIITGMSGSGKTSLGLELESFGLNKVVTHTTRPPRDGEICGKDYHFVTIGDFNKIMKIDSTEVNGNLYGISLNEIDSLCPNLDYYITVDKRGYVNLRNYLCEDSFKLVYLKVSKEIAFNRMVSRNDHLEDVYLRLEHHDKLSSDELFLERNSDILIENDGSVSLKEIAHNLLNKREF